MTVVDCIQMTDSHFYDDNQVLIVCKVNWHDAERHDWLLTGVKLGHRKAACRERLQWVFMHSAQL